MGNPANQLKTLFGIGLVAAVIFLTWPGIDLWTANLFADGADGFPLRFHPVAKFFNEFINISALLMALLSLIGIAVTSVRKRPFLTLWRRHYAFLFLSLALGPGVVANWIFKEHWGRARPRQILEFGGEHHFTAPFIMTDQCSTNCSFVSGDASMGFAFLAIALVLPKTTRVWSVPLALLFGAFIGLVRMVQGAHFLSDVIFAGLFTVAVIVALEALMLGRFDPLAPKTMPLWQVLFPKHPK